MLTLLHLSFSPWSEKARWALDHHRIAYEQREYLPMLGEIVLRKQLKRWRGPVSVPVLFNGGPPLTDSFEIARYADAHGSGKPLFPRGRELEVALWNARGERLLRSGRQKMLSQVLKRPEVLDEFKPPSLPDLGRAGRALTAVGVRYVLGKYASIAPPGGDDDAREVLEQIRAGLGKQAYLLGSFSYADIAVAAALQLVSPAERHLPLRPLTRELLHDAALAREYADLLAYRDRLYDEHRTPS